MGPRVRGIFVLLSLLAIAALAVPLALSSADRRTATLAEERGRQLTALADEATLDSLHLQSLVDRYREVYGEAVLVVDADGRPRAASGLGPDDPGVTAAVGRALVDEPPSRWDRVLPWHREPLLVATGVRQNGELVGAVVMRVEPGVAARDVAWSWAGLALGCLGLLALAVVLARLLTRWVLRPLHGLERAVADMTRGVSGPPVSVAGPPELRHFTSAFNTMADVVRRSLDRQRRLVADASHQLRNPLAAVRLRADSLDGHVAEAGRATYDAMTAELDRLEDLLHQLLRLARAEELSGSRRVGLDDAEPEATRLDETVEGRMAFWQPVAQSRDQRLVHRPGRRGLSVRVDEHEVAQLLDVALDNASRYAGRGATVTVSTADRGEVAELVVSDDGPGLASADLERAAERFWRGQNPEPSGEHGTGLGLAIAREIVQGHRGSFGVEQAPEGGLLVRFGLPMTGRQP
jgi:signal transduction histidine kinase